MNASAQQLQPLVASWLPTQRWFAGKGREMTVEVAPLAALDDADTTSPEVAIWTARVTYDDGSGELYQLPLVVRDSAEEGLEHVLLGSFDDGERLHWVYDALHDKDVTRGWLAGIRDAARLGPLTRSV